MIFLAIINRDIKINFKNLGNIFNSLIFLIITFIIFNISVNNFDIFDNYFCNQEAAIISKDNIILSFLIIAILFTILFIASDFLKEDFYDGTLYQLYLEANNFEIVIFAKIISNFIIYCLPIIIITPLLLIISSISYNILDIIITIFLLSYLLNLIISLFAIFNIFSFANLYIISILSFPIITPIIIFTNNIFINNHNYESNILILLSLAFFLTPIIILMSSFLVKNIITKY